MSTNQQSCVPPRSSLSFRCVGASVDRSSLPGSGPKPAPDEPEATAAAIVN